MHRRNHCLWMVDPARPSCTERAADASFDVASATATASEHAGSGAI